MPPMLGGRMDENFTAAVREGKFSRFNGIFAWDYCDRMTLMIQGEEQVIRSVWLLKDA